MALAKLLALKKPEQRFSAARSDQKQFKNTATHFRWHL
jgi:hypothetical protein